MKTFTRLAALAALLLPGLLFGQTSAPTPAPVTPDTLMPPLKTTVRTDLLPKQLRAGYTDRKILYFGCNTGHAADLATDAGHVNGAGFYSGCNPSNAPTGSLSDLSFTTTAGAFRLFCLFSHIAYDDPIVWPGQAGKTHPHAFYGNTSTNFKSDPSNFEATGGSTCGGGLFNRSAYWVPFFVGDCPVDIPGECTRAAWHGFPLIQGVLNVYYKSWDTTSMVEVWPPKGFRMISGQPSWVGTSSTSGEWTGLGAPMATGNGTTPNGVYPVYYECWNRDNATPIGLGLGSSPNIGSSVAYRFDHIPTTAEAAALAANFPGPNQECNLIKMNISFGQCLKDVALLDSPDHASHIADPNDSVGAGVNHCPVGFRAGRIPSIEYLAYVYVPNRALLDHLRLTSDPSKAGAIAAGLPCAIASKNYCAGVTGHGDWANGWDQTTLIGDGLPITKQIMRNCYPQPGTAGNPGNTRGKSCSDQVIGDLFQDGKNWVMGF